jgi:hypothetical protein
MNLKQPVECELTGETEVLGENLPHCHFVHQVSCITWPVFEFSSDHVGFVVDKVAMGQVFSEYFGFPCQFKFIIIYHLGLVQQAN